MKSVSMGLLAAALAVSAAVSAAPVQVLGFAPDTTALTGWEADANTPAMTVDVTVAGGWEVTRIEWWGYGLFIADPTDAFVVELGGTALPAPSGKQQVATIADPSLPDPVALYRYAIDLAPGTYFGTGAPATLSILNDTFDMAWYWQGMAPGGNSDVAYAIFAAPPTAVPEPLSLALVLAALAAAGIAGRRCAA